MRIIRKYADNTSGNSISNKFRKKRFEIFTNLIKDLPKPVKILDAGGTVSFWKQMGMLDNIDIKLTILNIEQEDTGCAGITFVKGDARNLSEFKDNEFDIVFSNSVIEHVGNYSEQKKMADEIVRTGKKYCVQTPNYNFPFEPHFLFPLFQFFPLSLKKFMLINFRLGWFEKAGNQNEALEMINSIRLLKKNELKALFPESQLISERVLFLTKSYVAIGSSSL